jgi:hypothetical protein
LQYTKAIRFADFSNFILNLTFGEPKVGPKSKVATWTGLNALSLTSAKT